MTNKLVLLLLSLALSAFFLMRIVNKVDHVGDTMNNMDKRVLMLEIDVKYIKAKVNE